MPDGPAAAPLLVDRRLRLNWCSSKSNALWGTCVTTLSGKGARARGPGPVDWLSFVHWQPCHRTTRWQQPEQSTRPDWMLRTGQWAWILQSHHLQEADARASEATSTTISNPSLNQPLLCSGQFRSTPPSKPCRKNLSRIWGPSSSRQPFAETGGKHRPRPSIWMRLAKREFVVDLPPRMFLHCHARLMATPAPQQWTLRNVQHSQQMKLVPKRPPGSHCARHDALAHPLTSLILGPHLPKTPPLPRLDTNDCSGLGLSTHADAQPLSRCRTLAPGGSHPAKTSKSSTVPTGCARAPWSINEGRGNTRHSTALSSTDSVSPQQDSEPAELHWSSLSSSQTPRSSANESNKVGSTDPWSRTSRSGTASWFVAFMGIVFLQPPVDGSDLLGPSPTSADLFFYSGQSYFGQACSGQANPKP